MAKGFQNQVIGLVRFSYPALSGFVQSHETPKEQAAFLYDPDRLDRRFHLFEAVCLPALLAQSDPDFTMLFLVGDDLPDAYKIRLADLVEPLKSAAVIEQPSEHHYTIIKRCFSIVPQDGFTHRTSFRLDDDDALDRKYIKRLKTTCRKLKPLCATDAPVAIGFQRGFYVRQQAGGNEVFDAVERTPLSVGTALMTYAGHKDNIYARNHRKLGQFYNLYSDMTAPAYIRAIHSDNDSDPTIEGRSKTMKSDDVKSEINRNFATSYKDLLNL